MVFARKLGALAALAGLSIPASAALIVNGSGSGFGSPGLKSAQVQFDVDGTDLVVTLTNTGPNDVLVPADVLTAVMFDVSGASLSLSQVSGLLYGGSNVVYSGGSQPAGGVIGGEWAYKHGLSGVSGNPQYGISSTGIGNFGPGDLFPGPNLAGPSSPDGVQYGLASAGDDPNTGNGGITGSGGLIKNAAQFRLSGLPANFDLNRIGNVFFFYGTAIGEGGFTPEPGSLGLLGIGAAVVMLRKRR